MDRRDPPGLAARVAADLGSPDLAARLARLPGAGLTTLLLEAFRGRAARATEAGALQAARNALFAPSSADARLLHVFDAAAFAAAGAFEAVDLSPVVPLGAAAALGGIDQNNVLSALRGAELAADPTLALALLASRRRRPSSARRAGPVRLCATQRVVRTQPIDPEGRGFTPHFRLFVLVTAGRDAGEHRFEVDALREHVALWLALVEALRALGFRIGEAAVELSDAEAVAAVLAARGVDARNVRRVARAHRVGEAAADLARRGIALPAPDEDPARAAGGPLPAPVALRLARIRDGVAAPIAAAGRFAVRFDLGRLEGLGYYAGPCFRIRLGGPAGPLPAIDGGFTRWTARLLADAKERLLTSGIGSELVCKLCAPAPDRSRGAPAG